MVKSYNNALGIDIGDKRVGVARMNVIAKIPEPLATYDAVEFSKILPDLIAEYEIDLLVIGLPRNMSGEETAQTQAVRSYVHLNITPVTDVEIRYADETLTSVNAEERMTPDQKKRLGVDSLAAAEILEIFARSETV